MKKVLSLVLVIAMVLSSMSFAFASNLTDIADNDYEDAINTLVALDVVAGYEDGTFRPEKTITRAEMAKMMVVTLGYGDLVAGSKSNFADTQGHWADAYIALAAGKGIVVGTGDGKFAPDRTVSYDEVYTMLVRGLGYTDGCNELKGMTWPTNFKVKAAELGITKDIAMSTTGADRGGVAQAIYNALESTLVSVDSDGNVVNIIDRQKNGVELLSRIADLDEDYDVTTDKIDVDNKNYAGDKVDLAQYMFQNLKVYLNDDDEVVFVKDTNSLVYEGSVDEVTTTETVNTLAVEENSGKIQKIKFATEKSAYVDVDESFIFENGAIRDTEQKLNVLEDTDTIKVVAKDANENGKIDTGEIVGYVTTIQTKVARIDKEYVAGKSKIDTFVLPEDDDDEVDLANITVTGDATSLEDIKVDDVVVEYASEDETVTKLVVTRNSVEGKITRVDGTKFYIDGTKYKMNGNRGAIQASELKLGDEGVFYLDQDGKIADYDGESAGPTDYAVVIGTKNGTLDLSFEQLSINDYPQLKLATQNNETIVYDIEVDVDSDGNVSDSAEVDDVAIIADGTVAEVDELKVTNIDQYSLIKYSLNKAGRISDVEVVSTQDVEDLDLDKSNNKLLSDAVIFDATGNDYEIVNANVLPTEVTGKVVRNKNGEIEVLIADDGQVDSAADVVYAFIYKANESYDPNSGDKVQYVGLYTDNADKGLYTTEKKVFADEEGVIAIKYDGDAIKKAEKKDIEEDNMGLLDSKVVTASAVNARGQMIEINKKWYAMSDHATVVNIDKDGYEDGLGDLYDIDENVTELEVYINSDNEVDLILILNK